MACNIKRLHYTNYLVMSAEGERDTRCTTEMFQLLKTSNQSEYSAEKGSNIMALRLLSQGGYLETGDC